MALRKQIIKESRRGKVPNGDGDDDRWPASGMTWNDNVLQVGCGSGNLLNDKSHIFKRNYKKENIGNEHKFKEPEPNRGNQFWKNGRGSRRTAAGLGKERASCWWTFVYVLICVAALDMGGADGHAFTNKSKATQLKRNWSGRSRGPGARWMLKNALNKKYFW